MKEQKKLNNSILIIFLSILALAVGVYYLNGLSADMKDLRQSLKIAKNENEAYKKKQKDLDSAIAKMKSESATLEKLKAAMPMGAQMPDAMINIDGVVAKLSQGQVGGVKVVSYQIGTATDSDGKVPVNLTIETSLDGLLGVISVFHNNLRPFVVDSISITAKDNNPLTVSLVVALTYTPPVNKIDANGGQVISGNSQTKENNAE